MKVRVAPLVMLVASLAAAGEGVYLVRGAHPVPVARNGFVQTVVPQERGWVRVEVATDPSPVDSRRSRRWPRLGDLRVPRNFSIPTELAARLGSADDPWERATRVLEWVMGHLEYDASERAPQDAVSVLARGRGRCSGIANAAVGLLRASGFPARTVSGLLVGRKGATPHRWLEVRLPGAGWVPTDPTLGIWVVSARHVACAGPEAGKFEIRTLVRPREELSEMPRRGRWPYRPNRGAILSCRVPPGAPAALAVLTGPTGSVRRAHVQRSITFEELLPGRWWVTVTRNGAVVGRFPVLLEGGAARTVMLPGREGVG